MQEFRDSIVREPDERSAPFVFAFLALVLVWIAAIIWWVYWYRGYA
jgi:hypothetical protein